MKLLRYRDTEPELDPTVFVAPGAYVIGDVTIGEESSLWFHTVVRGDVFHIRIGKRTNIQDACVLHVRRGRIPCIVGDEVTVGHGAILHACTVGDRSLIGMGAVVMDGAEVGEACLVGARALLTPGFRAPPRSLVLGSPARVARELTDEEVAGLPASAENYVRLAAEYRAAQLA